MKYFLLLFLIISSNFYEYENNKPSSQGIDDYVNNYQEDIYLDVQNFLNDTIYDFFINTDNLSLYTDYDSMELGRYIYPYNIIITNEEKFIDYKLAFISKWKRKQIGHSGKFVKAVVIHELMHVYFNQVVRVSQYYKKHVDKSYLPKLSILGSGKNNWSAEFIEEGVCEYLSQKMGESLYDDDFELKSEDILKKPDNYDVKYRYSSKYLRTYLDSCYMVDSSLFHAIQVLIANPPPLDEELINTNLYFNRLISD